MTVVLPASLVLSPASAPQRHWPIISWNSLVTISNVIADSEIAGYPASNLANPATDLRWKSDSLDEQRINVAINTADAVNCVAIGRHNFGSGGVVAWVEGKTGEPGAEFEILVEEQTFGDDSPIILWFDDAHLIEVNLVLVPDAVKPWAAVMHVSTLLQVPRGLPPGYTPITDGLDVSLANGMSQGGERLGAIITHEQRSTAPSWADLDPAWYDTYMRPFVLAANEGREFFFAWSPVYRPREVGYCWLVSAAKPVISQITGEKDIALQLEGIAS